MERDAHTSLLLSPQEQVEPRSSSMESMNGSVEDHEVVKVEVKDEVKEEYITDCTGKSFGISVCVHYTHLIN